MTHIVNEDIVRVLLSTRELSLLRRPAFLRLDAHDLVFAPADGTLCLESPGAGDERARARCP